MPRRRLPVHCALLAVATAGSATGQSWSVAATAPPGGSAQATVHGSTIATQTVPLPAGPVAPGTFLSVWVGSGGSVGAVTAAWAVGTPPPAATLQFDVNATASATLVYGHTLAMGSVTADLDLVLQAPAPTSGRLRFDATTAATGQPMGSMQVDIGADGTVEWVALHGDGGAVNLPLQIGAGGAIVRIRCDARAQLLWQSAQQVLVLSLRGRFYPGEPAVHPFATPTGAATLSVDQPSGTSVTLTAGDPFETGLLLAFGLQPTSVPVLPAVTQLVTLDAVLPVGSITLALPPMPPGTAFYAQGLVSSFGQLRSTGSVRALWP